jgi:hypothetical protein
MSSVHYQVDGYPEPVRALYRIEHSDAGETPILGWRAGPGSPRWEASDFATSSQVAGYGGDSYPHVTRDEAIELLRSWGAQPEDLDESSTAAYRDLSRRIQGALNTRAGLRVRGDLRHRIASAPLEARTFDELPPDIAAMVLELETSPPTTDEEAIAIIYDEVRRSTEAGESDP